MGKLKGTVSIGLTAKCPRFHAIIRQFYSKLRTIFYAGSSYECPFCEKTFRKFLPFGHYSEVLIEMRVVPPGLRVNSRCPNCRSIDRERHIFLYMNQRMSKIDRNVKLLHFSPERGLGKALSSNPGVDYVSVNLAKTAMVSMDVTSLGFSDFSFDVIVCSHILEHVLRDQLALSELFRVLKPGGWAVILSPISLSLARTYEDSSITSKEARIKAFGQEDHVRIYGKDFIDRLRDAGFIVTSWNYAGESSSEKADRYRILKDERLFICEKPNERLPRTSISSTLDSSLKN